VKDFAVKETFRDDLRQTGGLIFQFPGSRVSLDSGHVSQNADKSVVERVQSATDSFPLKGGMRECVCGMESGVVDEVTEALLEILGKGEFQEAFRVPFTVVPFLELERFGNSQIGLVVLPCLAPMEKLAQQRNDGEVQPRPPHAGVPSRDLTESVERGVQPGFQVPVKIAAGLITGPERFGHHQTIRPGGGLLAAGTVDHEFLRGDFQCVLTDPENGGQQRILNGYVMPGGQGASSLQPGNLAPPNPIGPPADHHMNILESIPCKQTEALPSLPGYVARGERCLPSADKWTAVHESLGGGNFDGHTGRGIELDHRKAGVFL